MVLATGPGNRNVTSQWLRAFHSEHRRLEAYSRAREAAGLLTEAIREPRPPDAVVAAAPGERRWQRIPMVGARFVQ